MPRNVEIKARVTDLLAIRARVEALGASGPELLLQTDTFFNVAHGRLKLREFGDGSGELIAYKRPDITGPKLSSYSRTPILDPTAVRKILEGVLGVHAAVKKRRLVFLLGRTRIHLDDVEGLGTFIEFEVVLRDDQAVEDGERIAADLMIRLGITEGDLVSGAYADTAPRLTD